MDEEDEYNAFAESDDGRRFEARLAALTEYGEVQRRILQGAGQPGDRAHLARLDQLLDGLGGLPIALRWSKRAG
jgi:hypothetical protein